MEPDVALNPNAMTSVETLRGWLLQNASPQRDGRLADAPLEALICRASSAIEAHCGRQLIAPSEAETVLFDGDDSRRLVLPEWPIAEFVGLAIDGAAIPARSGPDDDGYVVRAPEAWLELVGWAFTRGVQNVAVTARLGYDRALAVTNARHRRALDALEQACLLLAAWWFERPVPALVGGTGEGLAQSFDPAPWPAEVRAILAPYRRLGA